MVGSVARAAVAAAGAGTLVAGCASGTPEGFTRLEQGWLAVDVPAEWVEVAMEQTGPYDLVLQDTESAQDAELQLAAATEYGTHPARGTLSLVRAGQPFGPIDDGDKLSEVEGQDGQELWRWDFTYDDGGYQGVTWVAHDPEAERTVVVALTAEELDERTVQDVEDSIEVRVEDA
ncbi:hypothetical protein [Georgenia sp. AZ-5]|uniref:hypothetical protein n=1 Tax=Georgenia sp. AZ-5 TaxID=3367526 RepID=UPI0037541DA7